MTSIVDVEWLKQHHRDANVRVLDVRWSIAASGRSAYEAGHVPGAVFVDLETELSAPNGPGRHPIPDRAQVERVFGSAGIDETTHVVAYDDAGGSVAARVWFLAKRHGHRHVSILEGGFKAWNRAGGEVTREVPSVAPTTLRLREAGAPGAVDKAFVVDLLPRLADGGALLLDARAGERYRGESEPIDARAGHIPGAKSAPWNENLVDREGVLTFKSPEELRAHYTRLGADRAREIVVYCGSSVTACLDLMGLERAGFDNVRVYEGSWSEWARDAALPAARGTE